MLSFNYILDTSSYYLHEHLGYSNSKDVAILFKNVKHFSYSGIKMALWANMRIWSLFLMYFQGKIQN